MILVTGNAGGGTTFVTKLLSECGYDIGDLNVVKNKRNDIEGEQRRGLEHQPISQMFRSWNLQYCVNELQAALQWDSDAGEPYRENVAYYSETMPEVIKNPMFTRWLRKWLDLGGKRPEYIILCMRDTLHASFSNGKSPYKERMHMWHDLGKLLETVAFEDIPMYTVLFPKSVIEKHHIWYTVPLKCSLQDYRKAWEKVADPKGIVTREEDVETYRKARLKADVDGHMEVRVFNEHNRG